MAHSLAAGPDGQCALCRSESLPPSRPYPVWMLGGILVAILLVTVGALAQRGWRHALLQPAGTALAAQQPAPVTAEPFVAEPPANEEPGEQPMPFEQPPTPALPAAAAVAPPSVTSAPSSAQTTASAPRPRPRPSEEELRAAFNATPIVMYATSWCGVCRRARAFMAENGLRYQEIDADKAAGGWDKVQALSGERAVPVIVVDGEVSAGLSPERIMTSVAHSMERRLGITGVSFRPNRPNLD